MIALASVLSSQAPSPPALTLLAREGRRTLALTVVGDQEFVALDDLAGAFQLAVREESGGALTVSYKGRTILLTADQALASIAGRLISLPAPPARSGRRWLVPVEFIGRALATIYDVKLDLRRPSRLVVVGDLRVPRIAVRYDAVGVDGRVTIDATPRASSTVTQEGDRLVVKFDADALDFPTPPALPPGAQPLVLSVRASDAATLTIATGPKFAGVKSATQPLETTLRLVLDLAARAEAPPPATPAPAAADLQALTRAAPQFRTIVIDPGHGGDDAGATGANGTKEKDLALAIARRLRTMLEGRLGIRVLLTREDDRRLGVDDRTALANNNKADLFISLHAGASARPASAGAMIFFAAFEKDTVQEVSAGHVPTFNGGTRDIELVPWELAQTRHLDQSTTFAGLLQTQLTDRIPLAGDEPLSAPLRVLESANMPAVLIELGYLTNEEQEKLLGGEAFANTFVQALADAVVKFRDAVAAGGAR